MNQRRFDELLAERVAKTTEVLSNKGNEYSTPENKLHNFDRGAAISGKIREKVILSFLLKHQISLLDIVDKIELGILPSKELLDEKIGDIINYHVLLESSIVDRIEKEKIND